MTEQIEALFDLDVQKFIHENREKDTVSLAYRARRFSNIPTGFLLAQIKGYQKAKVKIPSFLEVENIVFPAGISMEQCSSELTAKYKRNFLKGERLLDLTGGFGIDSIFLADNFLKCIYVEQNKELSSIFKWNLQQLGLDDKFVVHHLDCVQFLHHNETKFDCAFIDPARRDHQNNRIFRLEDCEPNVYSLMGVLRNVTRKLLIKASPMCDISHELRLLGGSTSVIITSVKNEVKEVSFLVDFANNTSDKRICIDIGKDKNQIFEFDMHNELELNSHFSMPKTYVYEPYKSILKAAGIRSVGDRYQLEKLHRDSHFFTSNRCMDDFPGRIFKLQKVVKPSKKVVKKEVGENRLNVICRNYPTSVEVLTQKLGIKEGGENYLLATTLADNSKKLLYCSRIK